MGNCDGDAGFLDRKVASVLSTAAARGHRCVVLGAWGCGAFGNCAEDVARAFRRGLARHPALDAVFAVPSAAMLAVFQRVLQDSAPAC